MTSGTDAPGPQIVVDPLRHWCPAHLSSFRADWPKGYLPASLIVFAAFTRLPAVWEYVDNDATRLNEAMDALGPMCCKIDEGLLSRIIGASLRFAEEPAEWRALHDEVFRTP